ncbi:MAG TPA: hypothetical protein VK610_07600, partial [Rhodothermales bacterium]|nr:hypothetical protein [Rhodothermales bacterium]
MRLALLTAVLLCPFAAPRAQASAQPPPYPVLFVHGLTSSDLTWQETVEYLEDRGWGVPYTYHADLNAAFSTYYGDDIVMAAPVPYWDFAPRVPGADSVGAVGAVALDAFAAVAADRGTLDTRLFFANFETYYDAGANQLIVHDTRDASGESNSNCAAVTKQAVALGAMVADVMARTGAPRVILMGHSLGGLAIREYLQRRLPNGQPAWWVAPGVAGGHRVAAAVTTGTPHQGSNTWNFGLFCSDSEATRDLRYSYLSTGEAGRFLYGGSETIQAYWYNDDVNADGDVLDTIAGVNQGSLATPYARDNPAHPLPLDVAYTYIYSETDLIVDPLRQRLQYVGTDGQVRLAPDNGPRLLRHDNFHTSEPGDYVNIEAALLSAVVTTDGEAAPDETVADGAAAVRIYPNPARGPVAVEWTLPRAGAAGYHVRDALGRVV